jgi:hypothetical protein
MRQFEFKIDKDVWTVRVFPQEEYDEAVGDDSEAEVDVNQRVMSFCEERITHEVIEHELTHIYFCKCCLGSVDLFNNDQIQEILAEFVPRYSRTIISLAKKLMKKVKNETTQSS